MGEMLYYLPGVKVVGRKMALELGLAYGLDGPGVTSTEVLGPDQEQGCVFVLNGGAAQRCLYKKKEQTWERYPGHEKLWLGYVTEEPPGPRDLARAKQLAGHDVELGDEREWHVPVARGLGGDSPLPARLKWDGKDWAEGDIQPRYAELFGGACRAWDTLLAKAGEEQPLKTMTEECDLAVRALAVNYRMGPAEISLLGLFDETTEASVIGALVDLPAYWEFKKKQEADGASGEPGDED